MGIISILGLDKLGEIMRQEKIDVNFDFTMDSPGFWDGFWKRNAGMGAGVKSPLPGVLLCCSVSQTYKGAPLVWGSTLVFPCIRQLRGQPVYCSAAGAGMWVEIGSPSDGSTLYV